MGFEIDLLQLLVSVGANLLIVSVIAALSYFWETYILPPRKKPQINYNEKLNQLTKSLTQASAEVDKVLMELADVSMDRATAVQKLEEELKRLADREQETKKRIQDLENVPLAVAEHFAKLTESGEKRGARRDYMLFFAGLIAGQILQIVLKYFGY